MRKEPVSPAQRVVLGYAHGKHIEIGSHIGNSAILASYVAEKVTCIEPFLYSTPERFWDNLEEYEVDNVELITGSSYPWPMELQDREWDTAFIDGEHSFHALTEDLNNLASRVKDTMVVDDIVDGPQNVVAWLDREYDNPGTNTASVWQLAC